MTLLNIITSEICLELKKKKKHDNNDIRRLCNALDKKRKRTRGKLKPVK